jgi:hypothetical protein
MPTRPRKVVRKSVARKGVARKGGSKGPSKRARKESTAARELLAELRKSFLDDPDPDPEKEEMARNQVVDEPTIVHPLLQIVEEDRDLTIDQRSVIAGFGVDVLVNHGTEDEALFDAAIALVIDFLLRLSSNPKLIEPHSRVHVQVADALAVMSGDLDAVDEFRGSMKKTLTALRDFARQAQEASAGDSPND